MSRAAKDRASRLRRFRDADDEVRATGSAQAEAERFRAMRDKDVRETDFHAAYEELTGKRQDYRRAVQDRSRKMRFSGWRPDEEKKDV